jgi:hypothetical protein
MNKRPISILILSLLFIVVGLGGFIAGLWSVLFNRPNILSSHEMMDAGIRILSGALALTSGAFMLRAANWARWLCLVWLALHVLLSIFHTQFALIVHALLLMVVSYILFRSAATRYFLPTARA